MVGFVTSPMAQRDVRAIAPDQLWAEWRSDIERILQDAYELFSARRVFRDLGDVFRGNQRLQGTGGYLWDWMRVNYASYVIIRIRRETDDQGNTVNLNRLLREMEQRPEVATRGRWRATRPLAPDSRLEECLNREFTEYWVGVRPDPADPDADYIDPTMPRSDRERLQEAAERVNEVANRSVAHRTRVTPEDLKIREVDDAFEAIENTLQKYYALLHGVALAQAKPTPQFNTHEVFTFPWIQRDDS